MQAATRDLLAWGNDEPLLGKGNFGVVYERIFDGKIVAVKRIQHPDIDRSEANRELEMITFDHPNVLKLYQVCKTDDFIYLILEWCNGTLHDYFTGKYDGPVPRDADALYQLAHGLDYIHERRFVHRDIKSDNILILSKDANNPVLLKISDFGFCKPTNGNGSYSTGNNSAPKLNQVTTAPEMLKDDTRRANQKSDIFSLGCVFFNFLTKGQNLFLTREDENNSYAIPLNITKGKYWLEGRLREDQIFFQPIIEGMIKQEPNERTGLGDVLHQLSEYRSQLMQNP